MADQLEKSLMLISVGINSATEVRNVLNYTVDTEVRPELVNGIDTDRMTGRAMVGCAYGRYDNQGWRRIGDIISFQGSCL